MNISIVEPTSPTLPDNIEAVELSIDPDEWLEIDSGLVEGQSFSQARRLRIDDSKIENSIFTALQFDKFEVNSVVVRKSDLSALRTYRAIIQKSLFHNVRASGADFAEAEIKDCIFRDVKLDGVGFKLSNLKRVRFENCILKGIDFYGSMFDNVTFTGCDLENAHFDKVKLQSVDFRGENITAIKGMVNLKGAIISSEQLYQIAPILAADIGLVVE